MTTATKTLDPWVSMGKSIGWLCAQKHTTRPFPSSPLFLFSLVPVRSLLLPARNTASLGYIVCPVTPLQHRALCHHRTNDPENARHPHPGDDFAGLWRGAGVNRRKHRLSAANPASLNDKSGGAWAFTNIRNCLTRDSHTRQDPRFASLRISQLRDYRCFLRDNGECFTAKRYCTACLSLYRCFRPRTITAAYSEHPGIHLLDEQKLWPWPCPLHLLRRGPPLTSSPTGRHHLRPLTPGGRNRTWKARRSGPH